MAIPPETKDHQISAKLSFGFKRCFKPYKWYFYPTIFWLLNPN
jgi:hypothetical protein